MKTAHYILLLATLLMQTACKKNPDQVQPSPPVTEGDKEKYTLVSVTYSAIPGSTIEETTEPRPNLEYTNRTNLRQKIVVDPGGVFERSTFKQDPRQDYLIDDQGQLFDAPIEIQKDQVSLGAKKWTYTEQETKQPTQLNFKDSVYVESGKKLIGKLSMTYKKLQATYTAQLKGQSSGKLINVTGTWTGLYPVKKDFAYSTQDL